MVDASSKKMLWLFAYFPGLISPLFVLHVRMTDDWKAREQNLNAILISLWAYS